MLCLGRVLFSSVSLFSGSLSLSLSLSVSLCLSLSLSVSLRLFACMLMPVVRIGGFFSYWYGMAAIVMLQVQQ